MVSRGPRGTVWIVIYSVVCHRRENTFRNMHFLDWSITARWSRMRVWVGSEFRAEFSRWFSALREWVICAWAASGDWTIRRGDFVRDRSARVPLRIPACIYSNVRERAAGRESTCRDLRRCVEHNRATLSLFANRNSYCTRARNVTSFRLSALHLLLTQDKYSAMAQEKVFHRMPETWTENLNFRFSAKIHWLRFIFLHNNIAIIFHRKKKPRQKQILFCLLYLKGVQTVLIRPLRSRQVLKQDKQDIIPTNAGYIFRSFKESINYNTNISLQLREWSGRGCTERWLILKDVLRGNSVTTRGANFCIMHEPMSHRKYMQLNLE